MRRPAQRKLPMRIDGFSRRTVLSSTFGLLATLPAPPGLAEMGIPQTLVFPVTSAPLDRRTYRALFLGNGLRVLLASDPGSAKGSASMNVQVGFTSDPASLPGLAHFCEHMLFLGTKSFPNEGDFERYVGDFGGSNNAYTASEDTNYFFDVQGTALPSSLERFASFFTEPLFTPSATAREVSAIESEHNKNLQSDFWRYEQLFKLRADQQHPYAKFGTGNRKTLHDGDDATREELLKFHSRYYQADQMSLTIIGPQNLNDLQALAVKYFSAVPTSDPHLPSASSAYDTLPLPFNPARRSPFATLMLPVNDMRSLKIAWCLPVTDLDDWIRSKPDEIWSLLLRNRYYTLSATLQPELHVNDIMSSNLATDSYLLMLCCCCLRSADGGLIPLLKRRGLANAIDASTEEFTRSFMILSVSIDLTPLGLSKWRAVSALLFAYLRMLVSAGPPSDLIREYETMALTSFQYAEPSRPEDFATSSSGNLPFYPPDQWLIGPSTVGADSRPGVAYMLQWCADPRNAMVTLASKSFDKDATQVEPIYGTRYGTISLNREMKEWSSSTASLELHLPGANPFIPDDFSIKCSSVGSACLQVPRSQVAPQVITSRPGLRLHFLQDSAFRRPKAFAFFLFRSPILYASPQASVTSQLFQAVLADSLQDQTYQAGLAGLGAAVGAEYNGLYLTASGYNARLPAFIESVANEIKSAEVSSQAFKRKREALRQQLSNFKRRQPVGLASYHRGLTIDSPRFPVEELQAAVEVAKLEDIRAFQEALLPQCILEAFIAGNVNQIEAEKIADKTMAALPASAPLDAADIPRRRVRILPSGRTLRQYKAPNPDEMNSATEVYFQVGVDDGDVWICLAVLAQLLEQPFYGDLRTQQQLGYIVQSSVVESEGVRGLVFSIQSAVKSPPEVEMCVDVFLRSFRATLANLPEAELSVVREALASQATDVDQRLGQQSSRFWNEMVMRRYDYGRPWRSAARLRGVTRSQLLAFYDQYVSPDSPLPRRLSTHVFSASISPVTLVMDPVSDDFYPPPLDRFEERHTTL